MDPTKFCTFFAPSCDLLDPKNSCDLMDPNQNFPLTNPHVIWWTQVYKGFQLFLPSCTLMCFDGPITRPKPHVFSWTQTSCVLVDRWWFSGSIKPNEVFGSTKTNECPKNSCDLMDPDFKLHWVHQITWVKILPIFRHLMCFDGPRFSNFIGSIKSHEVLKNGQNLVGSIKSHECQKYDE